MPNIIKKNLVRKLQQHFKLLEQQLKIIIIKICELITNKLSTEEFLKSNFLTGQIITCKKNARNIIKLLQLFSENVSFARYGISSIERANGKTI